MKKILLTKQHRMQFWLLLLLSLISSHSLNAQPCTIGTPNLFGNPVDKVVCRGSDAQLGVNGSVVSQQYYFNVVTSTGNTSTVRNLGGPLIGNGGQLSVEARVSSSADTGRYTVQTTEAACSATSPGFYVYYGNIDDFRITSWGNYSVSFAWASCGRPGYVRYVYSVNTEPGPDISTDTVTTFNNFATVNNLTNTNVTYYIHVKVFRVYKELYGNNDYNGQEVSYDCSSLPWSTFPISQCSGLAAFGQLSAPQNFFCTGSTVTLTAGPGPYVYQWYKDDVSITSPSIIYDQYSVSQPGNYSVRVQTNQGCDGFAYAKYIYEKTTTAGVLSGGGSFCAGQLVRLKVNDTKTDQTYEIRRNGQLVTSFQGIGTALGFPLPDDTIRYEFTISSAAQAGNYTVTTFNAFCQPISFGSQDVIFVQPATASVSGTASVVQSPGGSSAITFSASGGQPPYNFGYTVNGGPVQFVSTTGVNNTTTVTQSHATAGSYLYTLVSISDASACGASVTNPSAATITVAPMAPDMTNSQFFSSTQLAAGGSIQEVIVLRNVGYTPTSAPVVFTVTNYSALTGLTAVSNNNPSVTIGFTTFNLANVADWNISSSPSALTFTSKPGVVISPGVPKYIGITINRAAGANGSVTHSSTVTAGTGGGDSQVNNNSISNTLLKN